MLFFIKIMENVLLAAPGSVHMVPYDVIWHNTSSYGFRMVPHGLHMDSYGPTYWALALAIAGREQRVPEIFFRRPWVPFHPPHPNVREDFLEPPWD